MARCPECNSILSVSSDMVLYDRLQCDSCGALLEVVSMGPIELEYVYDYKDIDDDDVDLIWDEDFDLEEEEELLDELLDEVDF